MYEKKKQTTKFCTIFIRAKTYPQKGVFFVSKFLIVVNGYLLG